MIRKRHEIDTYLTNFFISEKNFDSTINEALLKWYSSLGDKDHQKTRNNAIGFLKEIADEVLSEINYPTKERSELIETFEPLELLLRTALSLKTASGKHHVRDHLSHTVRNVLFTSYLLKKYSPQNHAGERRQLLIAAIFHDIAYPIEKLKQVGHSLGDATFKKLLNSKGHIEIELNNPDDLLEMLHFFGNTQDKIQTDLDQITDKQDDEWKNTKNSLDKINHIYTEIICKAIAGKGLFDSSHSISSVVLFLMPVIKYWRDSKSYQKINFSKISDICLTMTYHDRDNLIEKIPFEVPLILRLMRISDELQEWDRESDSFIEDVALVSEPSHIVDLKIILRNKSDMLCNPHMFIADKIKGLLPVTNGEIIKLSFETPVELTYDLLVARLKKIGTTITCNCVSDTKIGKKIDLLFQNSQVEINIAL